MRLWYFGMIVLVGKDVLPRLERRRRRSSSCTAWDSRSSISGGSSQRCLQTTLLSHFVCREPGIWERRRALHCLIRGFAWSSETSCLSRCTGWSISHGHFLDQGTGTSMAAIFFCDISSVILCRSWICLFRFGGPTRSIRTEQAEIALVFDTRREKNVRLHHGESQ